MTKTNTSTVECCVSFATEVDGVPTVAREGERYRSDNPLVLLAPQYFASPGTTTDERPHVRDFIQGGVTTTAPPRLPGGHRGRLSALVANGTLSYRGRLYREGEEVRDLSVADLHQLLDHPNVVQVKP